MCLEVSADGHKETLHETFCYGVNAMPYLWELYGIAWNILFAKLFKARIRASDTDSERGWGPMGTLGL